MTSTRKADQAERRQTVGDSSSVSVPLSSSHWVSFRARGRTGGRGGGKSSGLHVNQITVSGCDLDVPLLTRAHLVLPLCIPASSYTATLADGRGLACGPCGWCRGSCHLGVNNHSISSPNETQENASLLWGQEYELEPYKPKPLNQ